MLGVADLKRWAERITMNAHDAVGLAKDAIRLVSTAGLGKDVIDLLEKKLSLLTEELELAKSENTNLKAENSDLKKKLGALEPQEGIPVEAVQILKIFFDRARAFLATDIEAMTGMKKSVVDYHFGILRKSGLLKVGMSLDGPQPYFITDKGREFIVRNGMA